LSDGGEVLSHRLCGNGGLSVVQIGVVGLLSAPGRGSWREGRIR